MQTAPQPYLTAYLEVLYRTATMARSLAWQSQQLPWWRRLRSNRIAEQLADMMDAIHIIPELLDEWERCDEPALRRHFLAAYDQKWARLDSPTTVRFSMLTVFDEAFKSAGQEPPPRV